MKFRQLIEYNMGNIFVEKICVQSVLEKLFPDPYIKIQNRSYLWINSVKV